MVGVNKHSYSSQIKTVVCQTNSGAWKNKYLEARICKPVVAEACSTIALDACQKKKVLDMMWPIRGT